MICVFGSFVLGDLRILRLFGLGMAVAVLLDATLVRMVLVPSVMEILGRANWWMPRWLDRAVPSLAVEVTGPQRTPGAPQVRTSAREGDDDETRSNCPPGRSNTRTLAAKARSRRRHSPITEPAG